MTLNMTRRRAVGLAVVISLGFGAFTYLSGRRARTVAADVHQQAVDSVAVRDSVKADSIAAADLDRKAPAPLDSAAAKKITYRAGENPDYARRMGWPVDGPAPLPGAILPAKRIVAYYGNPLSKRMGALGEYEPQDMLNRLDKEVAAWRAADPATPVQPALHLIAVVAQADAGPSGKYRTIMRD